MAQLVGLTLILWSASGCVEPAVSHVDRCLEGTTATPDGCRAVPDWNPWAHDAGTHDAGRADPRDGGAPIDAGFPDGGTVTPTTAPPRDGGLPPPALDGLSGTWAMHVRSTHIVDNPYIGQASVQSSVIGVVEIVHEDERVTMATRICSIIAEPYGDMTTTFGSGYIGAIPAAETTAIVGSIEPGAPFDPTPRIQLVGWMAAQSPTDEPVPTEAEDPRVYDADGDGEPGATLDVSGAITGRMYVVQRSVVSLSGTIESPDRIVGRSNTEIERQILGADNAWLRAGETTREPHPNGARSPFELLRMPYGSGCGDVELMFSSRL